MIKHISLSLFLLLSACANESDNRLIGNILRNGCGAYSNCDCSGPGCSEWNQSGVKGTHL